MALMKMSMTSRRPKIPIAIVLCLYVCMGCEFFFSCEMGVISTGIWEGGEEREAKMEKQMNE